jgi:hypothetical protein
MTLQHYMRTVMLSSHLAQIVELSVDNQPGWARTRLLLLGCVVGSPKQTSFSYAAASLNPYLHKHRR